ncbi:MAG: monooxygenase, partial [Actinomycetota bacterium]
VRRQFFPHIAPQYSGYVGWRGLMSEAELSPETFELLADAITYCVLPNSHIVVYPIPTAGGSLEVGRRLINYVWYRNVPTGGPLDDLTTDIHGVRRPVSVPPGLVRTEFVDEMKAFAGDLAPQLAEAIAKTDQPFVQVIVDIETDRMVAGNVALLGDGAFSARPHAAAGTAKAAEDGWRLLAELERHDDLPAALSSWQQTQVALGRQLVARARAIGERSQVHCTWQAGDPELAFGLYGPGR